MIGDLYDANNVVVGQAAVLFAPEGTAMIEPGAFNTSDPFDLTLWTAVGDALWTPCGATDQGWKFGADKSTAKITIEEQSTPVAMTISSQSVTITGALSEDVTRTLALALNATVEANAAGATDAGYDLLSPEDDPIYYAVAMLTANAEGFGRIIYAPKWSQLSNASATFRRAADKRQYDVSFETLCKPSEILIYNYTAAKTA